MNILFLANHLNIGGISSYILTLSRGMKNKGHNVFVASGGGEVREKLLKEGVEHINVPTNTKAEISFNVAAAYFKLLSFIKKSNIDIIHANTRVTQVLSYFLSRNSGKPFISTCHGFFKTRWLRKAFPCWGRKVIAISGQVKGHLAVDFRLPDSAIAVIRNGIDTDYFVFPAKDCAKAAKERLGLGSGHVIGIVARLSSVKGHTYLIEAMKAVIERYPAAQLLIVGEGKIKNSLEAMARSFKIEKNTYFIPNILDTKEALSVIDIFVLPSLNEGLGLSLMEAMSMERAVVGSNVGGIPDLIKPQVNGLLVEPMDVNGLSQAILGLLKDPAKRQVFGLNARQFIKENFSQERMVSETEKVYYECLNSR